MPLKPGQTLRRIAPNQNLILDSTNAIIGIQSEGANGADLLPAVLDPATGSLLVVGVAVSPGQTVDTGNRSTQTITLPGVSSAIEVGNTTTANLALSANGSPVSIAKVNQVQFFGGGSITGAGHIVGSFNFSYVDATGKTVALAIGSENSLGMANGTTTRANSALNTINQMSSGTVMTLWTGATSVPTNVSAGATITKGQGFRSEITSAMLGTIGEWNGFYNADATGLPGTITTRFAFVNDDAGAVFKSKAPFCDNSFTALAPTNGGTTSIPAGVGLVVLNSGGTIASTTLAIAAIAGFTDGQKIVFFNVSQITAITWTSAGVTQLGLPTQLLANGFCTLQYAAAGPYWIRVG